MVSCSSIEEPIEDDNKEKTLSYYAGTWEYPLNPTRIYFIINLDGSITHKGNSPIFDKDETIPATSIKKINDTNLTYSFKNPCKHNGGTNAQIYFISDKECDIRWYRGNVNDYIPGNYRKK